MVIKVKFSPDGSPTFSLDPDWFPFLASRFGKKIPDATLDYRTAHSQAAYPDAAGRLLRVRDGGRDMVAPYTILVDYRDFTYRTLGAFRAVGRYSLPGELALLREAEVNRRQSAGKL